MRFRPAGIPVLLILLLCPWPSQAISLSGRMIFSLNPGISFYAMHDINRKIQEEQSGFINLSSPADLPAMNWGLDLGSSLHYGFTDFLTAGLDINYLTTNTFPLPNTLFPLLTL